VINLASCIGDPQGSQSHGGALPEAGNFEAFVAHTGSDSFYFHTC